MIDVALLSVIRRWHFREGMPIREIARRTGLSRNTVRKYLHNKEIDPKYPVRSRRASWTLMKRPCGAGCTVRPSDTVSSVRA